MIGSGCILERKFVELKVGPGKDRAHGIHYQQVKVGKAAMSTWQLTRRMEWLMS